MLGKALNLGSVLGIPLKLHYTWFIIFVLVITSLITYLPDDYPLVYRIVGGIASTLLLFASIVAHELAHSIVAIKYGISVKSITLFVFGGVAQITQEANRATTELLMAIVGPLASLLIAGLFMTLQFLFYDLTHLPIAELLGWLAMVNLFLALFNLIPGFPLDGGRVLRAIIWHFSGNYRKATRISTLSGRGVGYLFILGGIALMIITRDWFSGLWLAFIGWFLQTAANTSYSQFQIRDTFQHLTARDVMIWDSPTISRHLTIEQLVQEYILRSTHRYFIVAGESKLEGIISLDDIKLLPRQEWSTTDVARIMTPAGKMTVAHPEEDVLSILARMDTTKINLMPVVLENRVIGLLARDSIIHLAQTRSELGGDTLPRSGSLDNDLLGGDIYPRSR